MNNRRSWQAKLLPWSDSKHKCDVFSIRVPSVHHETMLKKVWCKVFLNSPNIKKAYRSLMLNPDKSPGQCFCTTKDLRTTGDYVASHKLSCKRSWQCPLLLSGQTAISHQRFVYWLKKKRPRKSRVMQPIVDEWQKLPAAAVPDRSSSLCCHWFSSPRSHWHPQNWSHSWS